MILKLEILSGTRSGETLEFTEKSEITLGREPSNTCRFSATGDPNVSGRHAAFEFKDGCWYLVDRGSTNGTYVNERRVTASTMMRGGEEVRLGQNGPRVRVLLPIPKTVLESVSSLRGEEQSTLSIDVPADAPSVPPVSTIARPNRSAVGSVTVLQMINSALESTKQSNRLARPTIFAKEILRQAARQSNRKLGLTMGALLVVLLAAFGIVFYRIASVRSELRLLKADVATGLQEGWQKVEANLAQQRTGLEKQHQIYDAASQELRRDLDRALGAVARDDERILALTADLESSRNHHSELVRQREAEVLALGVSSTGIASPEPPTSDRLTGLDSALQQEQQKQADILDVLAEAAAATGGGPEAGSEVREIGAQLLAADASAAQMGARLEHLEEDLGAAAQQMAQQDTHTADRVASGDVEAILDAITRIEVASAPNVVTPLAPITTVASIPESPSTTPKADYSKPYPRANLKKRLALGEFECLVAQNPWNLSRSDVGRQMRAQMTTLLDETGLFSVVEREDLDNVLDEQLLNGTATVTAETGARTGQLLGAQAVIIGKITQLDQQVVAKKASMNWGGMLSSIASISGAASPNSDFANVSASLAADPNLGTLQTTSESQTSTFTIHIDFKILDTQSGEVLFTTQGHGVATSTSRAGATSTSLISGGYVKAGSDSGADATRLALYDATIKIMEGMEQLPWRGRLMDRNGDRVVINGGDDVGLNEGDTFQVLSRGKELIDPETGKSRGNIQTSVGTVRVTSVSGPKSEADVIEQTAGFKPGDDLVYLGVTRPLQAGEDPDLAVAEKAPTRYGVINSPTAYSGPGESYATVKLNELEAGSPVRIRLALGDWAKVVLPSGSHAWMRKSNLAIKEEAPTSVEKVAVAVKKAQVRSAPSSRGKRVEVLRQGDLASVKEKLGGWYLVSSRKGTKGWMSEGDLTPAETVRSKAEDAG